MTDADLPPPPHDPREREAIAWPGLGTDGWEARQFPVGDARIAYFTTRGFLHLQLWHGGARTSILTPSRLTGGRFEIWAADAGRCAVGRWADVAAHVPGVALPSAVEIAALERWFVLRHEPAEVHLLRVWWASQPRERRQA